MELFFQLIVNGIIIGAVYALASLGYSMTFTLNINNFAHGSMIMLGSYASYILLHSLGVPLWMALPIIVGAGLLLGFVVFFLAIKPLIGLASWTSIAASTLALAVIFENIVLTIHGFELFSIRKYFGTPKIIEIYNVTFTNIQISLVVFSLSLLIILFLFIKKSDMGRQYQAVADDPVAAEAMGISTNKVLLFSLMLGGALATIAGLLISLDYDQDATTGMALLMKAYTATILGGEYNLSRVVSAAYFIGILENLVAGYISTEYMLASVFLVLIIFLLLRKEGLGTLGLRREI